MPIQIKVGKIKKFWSFVKPFKWIYLSKALTCMNFFLYKQELLFCQGDGYLWPHCCMNNLYISYRSLHVQTYSFLSNPQQACQSFLITSWFDIVYHVVTRWMNFRKKNNCKNMNHNYPTTIFRSILAQNVQISGRKIYIFNFCL